MESTNNILIIDSDNKFINEVSTHFIKMDLDVDSCTSVTCAVTKLKQTHFSCVIMDVVLPEMKGYEAVDIIKQVDSNIPIILTAAENSRDQEAKVREHDIFFYYIKSFEMDELKLAVTTALKKRKPETTL